jgi:dienelactone hydrolase
MAVWACSGNVPNALSVLMHNPKGSLRCAVLCYGYLLDLDGSTQVTASARSMGFVNPCAGASIDDVTQDTPLLLVRAGHDQMPWLNDTLDRFFRSAVASDLPVTCMNHARAAHGFDLSEDTEASRDTIRNIIEFMRVRLTS